MTLTLTCLEMLGHTLCYLCQHACMCGRAHMCVRVGSVKTQVLHNIWDVPVFHSQLTHLQISILIATFPINEYNLKPHRRFLWNCGANFTLQHWSSLYQHYATSYCRMCLFLGFIYCTVFKCAPLSFVVSESGWMWLLVCNIFDCLLVNYRCRLALEQLCAAGTGLKTALWCAPSVCQGVSTLLHS